MLPIFGAEGTGIISIPSPVGQAPVGAIIALPACSKIARTNVKVGKTRLLALVELRAQEQAFN